MWICNNLFNQSTIEQYSYCFNFFLLLSAYPLSFGFLCFIWSITTSPSAFSLPQIHWNLHTTDVFSPVLFAFEGLGYFYFSIIYHFSVFNPSSLTGNPSCLKITCFRTSGLHTEIWISSLSLWGNIGPILDSKFVLVNINKINEESHIKWFL